MLNQAASPVSLSRRVIVCSLWVLASALGGGAASLTLPGLSPVALVLFGALFSVGQALVLSRDRRIVGAWIAATTLGVVLGAAIGVAAGMLTFNTLFMVGPARRLAAPWSFALGICLAGLLVGLLQILGLGQLPSESRLRGRFASTGSRGAWLIASGVGWLLFWGGPGLSDLECVS